MMSKHLLSSLKSYPFQYPVCIIHEKVGMKYNTTIKEIILEKISSKKNNNKKTPLQSPG